MIELVGKPGELRFTLEITRKATGKTEIVDLVGHLDDGILKETENGSNTQHIGSERSD